MAAVLSIVRGTVEPDAVDGIVARYEAGLAQPRPPGLVSSWLLSGRDGAVAIATLWRDRALLDAMIATGEEPFARRLIREAGGSPNAEFFEVLAASEGPR
jgi:hypothetical protein